MWWNPLACNATSTPPKGCYTPDMKKAFSLVEMLVVCVVMAIMAMVGIKAYHAIREQAEKIAQNKDQAVLKQVVETFHFTGGNIAEIAKISDAREKACKWR